MGRSTTGINKRLTTLQIRNKRPVIPDAPNSYHDHAAVLGADNVAVPYLVKRAGGRDISGLSAYEQ
jgi:hypothetical protein